MSTAEELFTDPARRDYAAVPEMDPLTEAGALQEADLVAVKLDVMTASAGLLFDLRNALQLRSGKRGAPDRPRRRPFRVGRPGRS